MSKRARTSIPVHALIAERWSPRSFDESVALTREQVIALVEAARWAPSAMNLQPWRFAVAHRGSVDFEVWVEALAAGNRVWAHRASALIVAAAELEKPDGNPNPWARYDLGLAVSLLTVQAHAMDLHVHQIGGFDATAVATSLDLPASLQPVVVLAVGRLGDAAQLDEGPLRERELSVRERKPLEDIVLRGLEA